MNKILIFGLFLTSFIIFCQGNPVGTAGAVLDVVKQIKALIKSNSKSHITTREKNPGFEFLDMYTRVQKSKGLRKKHIMKKIYRSLQPFALKSQDKNIQDVIDTVIEYVEDDVEEHGDQFFTIVSQNGYGGTSALFVYYKLREDGKYNYRSMIMSGNFKLAATLVITRESKSNFFGSKSRDVIHYLPRRGITKEDVQALLNLVVPKMNEVFDKFLPDKK